MDMPVTINLTVENSLVSYHGVKFGDVDTVLAGIKRPNGSAGNFDPDWKGFYVADQKRGAIGYATVSDAYIEEANSRGDRSAYQKAGALLQVDFPGPVTIIEVNSEASAEEIKTSLGLMADKPLIDQIGDPSVVKSKWPGSRLVALKREVETLPGTYEIIIPWEMASTGQPKVIERFDKLKNGEDARQALDSMLNCEEHFRTARSVNSRKFSGDKICGINWVDIRDKSKNKVKQVLSDAKFINSLPNRDASKHASAEEIKNIYESTSRHPILEGGHSIIHKASLLTWAGNTVEVLKSQSSSSVDKISAIVGIVPGIGDVFYLTDSIENNDVEGIVTSSVALAGFTIAQAVPVVGEVIDAALIAEAVVSAVVNIISNYIQSTQRPAVSLPGAISPVTKNGVTVKWQSEKDQRIVLSPSFGRKIQILEITAEKGKSAPLVAIVGHQSDGYFNLEPERLIITQDNKVTTCNTVFVAQKSTYIAFPTSPVTITNGRPVMIRISYTTRDSEDRTVKSPFINLAIGSVLNKNSVAPYDVPLGISELLENNQWISTRFYVHQNKTCFSEVSYFNQGGYVAKLEIALEDKVLSTHNLALGQSEKIDLTSYNIPDGTVLSTRISVGLGPYKNGPDIKYCRGSGEIANLKSWGSVTNPYLDFG